MEDLGVDVVVDDFLDTLDWKLNFIWSSRGG
jgi:hypothetical protein